VSCAFSGRPGRSIATAYARAATAPEAPATAPYPIQRGLTAGMRGLGTKENNIDRIQAWAGQSAALAVAESASAIVERSWTGAQALLGLS
jgi:nitronate monooxygenase